MIHKKWSKTEKFEILRLHKSGKTYSELGKQYGFSANRMRQVCIEAERIIRNRWKHELMDQYPYLQSSNLNAVWRYLPNTNNDTTPAEFKDAIIGLTEEKLSRIPGLGTIGRTNIRRLQLDILSEDKKEERTNEN